MTIVVGANPFGDIHGAIDLGVTLARTLPEATGAYVLVIATVIPPGWTVPSMARVDGEMQEWVQARADEAKAAALAFLAGRADDLTVEFVRLTDRSTPRALAALAEQREATALVLGSSPDGPEGRVVVGSTADYLLHSSPVPLAVAPRAYRCAPSTTDVAAHRLTCSFSGSGVAASAVRWAARLTREIDVQLRVASFGVRSATMYPPEIGTDIESEVTEQWREQMADAQAALREALGDLLDDDTAYVVASGTSWWEALSSVDWTPNELLVLGSSSAGTLRRVFLGTNATKIIRHSPVPVLVVPHDEL
ncbi:universal stress protein [Cellulomonas xylanilytica]|uniref:Universal stress protein n=1 Tax=Cellulomonas xylanilytica TaxID=233583 RepID=A0A510V501_9CELL|nr:universal stress protein [Cellulomonas xylanilytica]GEK21886.1 universal stress protein [Cellulomonas xylanilytica]